MSNFKKIVSSSGINFLFRIFGLGSAFLITLLISRLFGVKIFGNYSLVFTVAQASAIVFALGIPNALIKLVGHNNYGPDEAKSLLLQGIKITGIFIGLPVIAMGLGAPFIASSIFGNAGLTTYFIIIAVSLPLFVIHELFLFFFLATQNFFRYNLFMFVLPNILLVVFLFLSFLSGLPEYFTIIALCLSFFIVVAAEVFFVFDLKKRGRPSMISSGQLIRTASPMMLSGIMMYLLNWSDILMLGAMTNETQVGIYNIAFKVGSVGLLVIVSVSTITTPKMADLAGRGDLAGLKKLIHSTTRIVALLSALVVGALILLAPYILAFFDEEAVLGTNALILTLIGVLFSAACGNVDQILNMTNNARLFRNICIVCFLLNVFLNFLFIPLYGINGAALASMATNIILNLACVLYIKKKLGFYTFA